MIAILDAIDHLASFALRKGEDFCRMQREKAREEGALHMIAPRRPHFCAAGDPAQKAGPAGRRTAHGVDVGLKYDPILDVRRHRVSPVPLDERGSRMLTITLYNHKGGVSKTTTTFNLAHALAESGKNVLLVDADPQCNLTELFMAPIIDVADQEAAETGHPVELPGTTILEALGPRFDGDVPAVNVDNIVLVPSPHAKYRNKVNLFRGDIGLSSAEDKLSQAHVQRTGNDLHLRRTYVAINDAVRRLGVKISADVALIDVGPSAGALTRSCFLACDAFFTPVAPDRFNVQAIGSLARIIGTWMTDHAQIVDAFRKDGLAVGTGKPLFLGTIVQNYKLAKGRREKPGFRLWMDRIPERVNSALMPVLKDHSGSQIDLLQVVSAGGMEAVRIPDFTSLATCMQEVSKPIFDLTREDTATISSDGVTPYAGAVWKDAMDRMTEWRKLFGKLEKRVDAASAAVIQS